MSAWISPFWGVHFQLQMAGGSLVFDHANHIGSHAPICRHAEAKIRRGQGSLSDGPNGLPIQDSRKLEQDQAAGDHPRLPILPLAITRIAWRIEPGP